MPRPGSCASCGKRLSKKQWYYRNGNFYCKNRCWTTAKDKAAETKAAKVAEDAAKAEAAAPKPEKSAAKES